MLNHRFWRSHFRRKFVPHLSRLLATMEHRLLPIFDNLEAEATKIQEETYDELMHLHAGPDCDPSVPAELAHDAGLDHYMGMCAVRQALLNSFAPILYHTWEQQLLEFHRREVLHPSEQHDHKLLDLKTVISRLNERGVDLRKLKSWPVIEELKLVANTTKHADGISATQLKELRPDLFEHPSTAEFGFPRFPHVRRVYAPLSGDDLYVSLNDLRRYGDAVVSFWGELSEAIAAA